MRFWMYAFHGRCASIWLHAASVGEVQLVARLLIAAPLASSPLVLTVQTPAGLSLARQLMPAIPSFLAPIDLSGPVSRCFQALQPAVLILIETELWPQLLSSAHARRVPVVVVNASLSPRSFRRHRYIQSYREPLFKPLHIWARTSEDLERFVTLGVQRSQARLLGELKRLPLPAPEPKLPPLLEDWLREGPLLIAASTHPSEEALLLECVQKVRAYVPALKLLLAPRHPARVVREQIFHGLPRRSQLSQGFNSAMLGQTLVLDTVGELRGLYAWASLVVVGGSFVPVGGHNVWEVAEAGVSSLVGPFTEQITEELRVLQKAGLCRVCADAAALPAALMEGLSSPLARELVQSRVAALLEVAHTRAQLPPLREQLKAWLVEAQRLRQEAPSFQLANPQHSGMEPPEPLSSAPTPTVQEEMARAEMVWSPRRRLRFVAFAQRVAAFRPLRPLLALLSWMLLVIWGVRQGLYRVGLWAQVRVNARVISVGGLESGGLGKTPVVAWLAERLENTTILTRGYGGSATVHPCLVHADTPSYLCGDEAHFLRNRLKNVPVVVDPQRVRAARWICERLALVTPKPHEGEPAQKQPLLILDDGFQHQALARDLEIVVVRPQPPEALLPLGQRREPLSSLHRAHLIWCHENGTEGEVGWWRPHTTAMEVRSRLRLVGVRPLAGGELFPLDGLASKPGWGLVTGIAHPERVPISLNNAGISTQHHWIFPDHHPFEEEELRQLELEASQRGLQALLTTEKDGARLEGWASRARLPWYVLQTQLEVLEGEERLRSLLGLLGCAIPEKTG